ncbi:MAG: protein kinase [Pirellulaceae bacterium]|nr:protein kinase [Pirellulaceae bacterium]
MQRCPQCNQQLDVDAKACLACGWTLEPAVTEDAKQHDDPPAKLSDTLDFPKGGLLSNLSSEDAMVPPGSSALNDADRPSLEKLHSTLDFVSDSTIDMEPASPTVDAIAQDFSGAQAEEPGTELLPMDTDSSLAADSASTEGSGWGEDSVQGTLRIPDAPAMDSVRSGQIGSSSADSFGTIPIPNLSQAAAPEKTVSSDTLPPGTLLDNSDQRDTLDLEFQAGGDNAGDQQATRSLDQPFFPVEPIPPKTAGPRTDEVNTIDFDQSDNAQESAITLDLGTGRAFDSHNTSSGTIPYSDDQVAAAAADTGRSTPSGQLRRVWGAVGGSSADPMHTLKVSVGQASDSIFQRVSPRLLVTSQREDILADVIKRAKDKQRDPKLIEACLSEACGKEVSETATPDYEINGYIGRGAMGVVFQGRQVGIGRDVAIKMIQPSAGGTRTASSTRNLQKKFLYEAQITGKLDHPNIVPVYELGMCNSLLFYTMKKIVGTEWKQSFSKRSKEENLDILTKVADAMAFAHQRQIIHRDLKPENVMLGPFGEVLVVDWGCAVDLSLKEEFSGAGSPPWMAPEMALHQRNRIGTGSDIYLLGAILYQIVVGHPPHAGRTVMEVLHSAAKNEIIATTSSDPLLKIALRAMQTAVEDRYATVEEMQEAIRLYQRHSESVAMTARSENLLEQAIANKDYERFSRSIFGFQEALELWPDNPAASDGLRASKFAYGQLAYTKGDYGQCLEVLDRNAPDQNALYVKAEKAKKSVEDRSKWLKFALSGLAGAIVVGLVVSTAFAVYASIQKNIAVEQTDIAEKQKDLALKNEEEAKRQAQLAKDNEEEATRQAQLAKDNEEEAKRQATLAKDNEEEAKRQAALAKDNEEEAKRQAALAKDNEEEAKRQATIAETQTSMVQLAAIQSNLSLAFGQVEQSDLSRATALISDIGTPSKHQVLADKQQLPLLKNWAWNRINLLSNSDLLSDPVGEQVTALAFSQSANRGVVALTRQQQNWLHIASIHNDKLVIDPQHSLKLEAEVVEAASISPDGQSVLYSLAAGKNDLPRLFRWQVGSTAAEPIAGADMRAFQGFVATDTADVAGLNQGLWVWSRNGSDEESKRIDKVQGRLLSMQLLPNNSVLVLAEMPNGQRYPHIVSLLDSNDHQYLRTQQGLGRERLSAVAYANGRLVLGTESGKLFSLPYMLGSTTSTQPAVGGVTDRGVDIDASLLSEIPQQHQSRIKSIRAHADGTLLTIAEEPQVNVWRPVATELGWTLDIRLTGTPSNVQLADFGQSSQQILALSSDTRSIVWDVNRQRLRQRVRRVTPDGQELDYATPVMAMVTSEDGQRAVSVLEDGTIDRWNIYTGLAEHTGQIPIGYVGHDPRAQFVDMSIDPQSGIMITSARLPLGTQVHQSAGADKTDSKKSLEWDWEFVKWDLNGMKMLDRWNRRSGEEQAVSLVGRGHYVLYGSDSETRFRNTANQSEIAKFDFGSFFGVASPKSSNLVMLVKLNGALQLVDVDNLDDSWRQTEFFALATTGDRPIIGQWSPAGDRFYLIWESGRVIELSWDGSRLALERDLRQAGQKIELAVDSTQPAAAQADAGRSQTPTIRIASRWNVDMKVRSASGHNLLYALVRFPGKSGLTRLTRIAFPVNGGSVQMQYSDSRLGSRHCVLSDDEVPQAITGPLEQMKNRHPRLDQQIAGMRTAGLHTYVATKSGTVLRVAAQQADLQAYGRPKLLSATGDKSANTIITLHEGGVLWRADWQDGQWSWRQLPLASADAESIDLSPDGSQLSIRTGTGLGLYSADTGALLQQFAGGPIAAFTWDRQQPSTFAIVGSDGTVGRLTEAGWVEIIKLPAGEVAKRVQYFNEAWNDPAKPKDRWLLVQTSTATYDRLHYFPLNPGAQPVSVDLPSRVTSLQCSPTEGLVAVGGYGTVAIYFSAPSLGEAGKELFSLPGHAGASVNLLQFTADGRTLLSGDRGNRMFGWLSADNMAAPVAPGVAIQPNRPDAERQILVRVR